MKLPPPPTPLRRITTWVADNGDERKEAKHETCIAWNSWLPHATYELCKCMPTVTALKMSWNVNADIWSWSLCVFWAQTNHYVKSLKSGSKIWKNYLYLAAQWSHCLDWERKKKQLCQMPAQWPDWESVTRQWNKLVFQQAQADGMPSRSWPRSTIQRSVLHPHLLYSSSAPTFFRPLSPQHGLFLCCFFFSYQ